MDILRCMDMFFITKILDLAYVQNYMRCLSQNKSDTKLFRVYLFARSFMSLNREDNDKYTLLHKRVYTVRWDMGWLKQMTTEGVTSATIFNIS